MGNSSKYGVVVLAASVILLSLALTITLLLTLYYGESVKESTDHTKDLDFIFSGIEKVYERVNSGILTIYGDNAFPVLTGKAVGQTLRPTVGAGRYGKGKFVIYTHASCFVKPYQIKENDKFFANVASWVAGGKENNITATLCVDNVNQESFQRIFTENKILSENVDHSKKQLENLEYLKQYDLIVLNYLLEDVNNNVTETVKKYVESGGGIIVGATSWALPEIEIPNGTTFQETFWGNKILNSIGGGLAFAQGHAYANTKPGGFFNVSTFFLQDTHAGQVSKVLQEVIDNRQIISREKYRQIYYILNDRSLYAPKDDTFSEQLSNQIDQLHELELITAKEGTTGKNSNNATIDAR